MKVFITGAAGYIGTMVTSHLLQLGYEVVAFDRCLFGAEPLLPFFSHRFRFVQGDIRDEKALFDAMQGATALVHLAAIVGEDACLIDAKASREINVSGTEIALSVAQQCGIEKCIFVSTCSNYGISSGAATEESSLNPLTEYAISKVLAEKLCFERESSFSTVVLRFGTICGLAPRMRFDLLINELARSAVLDKPIQIFSPSAWRPFLHVKDAARVIELVLNGPKNSQSRVYNVISENCQKGDLANLMRKHYPNCAIQIVEKSPDARDYRVDASRIEKELGFSPRHTIEEAVLEIADTIKKGIFIDPFSKRHSALPDQHTTLGYYGNCVRTCG